MKKPGKKILLIPVFLLVLLFVFFQFFRYNPVAHIKCIATHGTYEKPLGPAGGPIFASYCIYTYNDAGKKCTSSTQCGGDCLVTEETVIESKGLFNKKVVGGYGRCASTNKVTGCFPATMEIPMSGCR